MAINEFTILYILMGLVAYFFIYRPLFDKDYIAKKMLEENPSLEKDLKRMDDSFGELEKKLDEREKYWSPEAIKEREQKKQIIEKQRRRN